MEESPQDRIKRLIRDTAASNVTHIGEAATRRGRGINADPAPARLSVGAHAAGIVGNNNHITINVSPLAQPTVQVTLAPSDHHISATQGYELQQLVAKVVQVSGNTFAQVWGAFRRRFLVPSYRVLAADQHDAACQYLRAWIAAAEARGGTPAAPKRNALLARIHAEARRRTDLLVKVRDFAEAEFGTRSLSELDGGQLAAAIQYLRI
jgi:hypothetical protein